MHKFKVARINLVSYKTCMGLECVQGKAKGRNSAFDNSESKRTPNRQLSVEARNGIDQFGWIQNLWFIVSVFVFNTLFHCFLVKVITNKKYNNVIFSLCSFFCLDANICFFFCQVQEFQWTISLFWPFWISFPRFMACFFST